METHGSTFISISLPRGSRMWGCGLPTTRSGTHNMYWEYRDLTVSGAITLCCKWYVGAANHLRLCAPVTQMSLSVVP